MRTAITVSTRHDPISTRQRFTATPPTDPARTGNPGATRRREEGNGHVTDAGRRGGHRSDRWGRPGHRGDLSGLRQRDALGAVPDEAPRPGRRAAALAAAAKREVSAHCAPNLSVHAAAATPNFRHIEWFTDHDRIESRFFDGALDPANGTVTVDPGVPGHGLRLKEPDVETYTVAG
ncbi:enolase C-terminal domain-like protein [Amycolatopsis sp. NPDC059027]|uniref:enolase C-terminal domain-like protein n=1 Tax=unclassified Amycolatopsis TaxID=2618356 RepID=UPI00366AD6A6